MNKTWIKRILVVGLALIGFVAAEAFAQTTANVTVQANVVKGCRFDTTTATMTIANSGVNIDPSNPADATGQVFLGYHCTNGTSPVFDINTSGSLSDPKGPVSIPFSTGPGPLSFDLTVTGDPSPGGGFGVPGARQATIDGFIANANLLAASVGAYSEVVVIEIQAP